MHAATGTGKYERLLARCERLAPVPTAVAHPCEATALEGAVDELHDSGSPKLESLLRDRESATRWSIGAATVSLVVETGCAFFAPIRFPDRVQCGLRVAHLGTSSVRYEIGVFRNDERLASARGHFVHVCCDRATQAPVAMPAALRTALARLRVAAP